MKKINTDDIEFSIEGSPFINLARVGDLYIGSDPKSEEGILYIRERSVQSFINVKMPDESAFNEEDVIERDNGRYFNCPIMNLSDVDGPYLQAFDQILASEEGPVFIYGSTGSRVIGWMALHLGLIEDRDIEEVLELVKHFSFFKDDHLKIVTEILEREKGTGAICL